jgi:hypothetical protein
MSHIAIEVINEIVCNLAASFVDSREADDNVFAIVVPFYVSEYRVYTNGSVGDENNVLHWGVEKFGDSSATLVEQLGVFIANERIRTSLARYS